jgi:hypothetical protein
MGQFYPVIPNKRHKSRKSWSKRFEFSTLGATENRLVNKDYKAVFLFRHSLAELIYNLHVLGMPLIAFCTPVVQQQV